MSFRPTAYTSESPNYTEPNDGAETESQVIIVGGGLAGMVAAYEAVRSGLRVTVVEQEGRQNLGAQAFWSLGGLFYVDSPEQRLMGVKDSEELAWRDWENSAQFDDAENDYWPRRWGREYVRFAAQEKRDYLKGMGLNFYDAIGMLTTAAGTVKPATVMVLGVGVSGLQALATARRLGARTIGYDVRPEVAEQVKSVGAKWLDLGIEAAGEGGYARELTEEEKAFQQERLAAAIGDADAVITTALVPGRRAPILVTADAASRMKPGSVIVDLAGETGGNCELTEPGKTVVKNSVTICSPLNLPATMPEHSSELYAKNIQALLELMLNDEGALAPDFEDEILASACVTRDKEA